MLGGGCSAYREIAPLSRRRAFMSLRWGVGFAMEGGVKRGLEVTDIFPGPFA